MPPRARASGGGAKDPLDVALAAHPTQIPASRGFFQALKPQSPLFPQTSRINVARPDAQAKTAARIVPPPQAPPRMSTGEAKKILAAHTPHASSVTGLLSGAAHAVEQAPHAAERAETAGNTFLRNGKIGPAGPSWLGGDMTVAQATARANEATNKAIAGLTNAKPQAPEVGGEASTYAGLLNGMKGIPFANVSAAGQQKIHEAMDFFQKNPSYHYQVPDIGYYTPAQKKALGLPLTATDADVMRYYGTAAGHLGHRDWVEGFVHNLPGGLLNLAALPVAVGYLGTHPTTALPEFARENVAFGKSFVEHPLKTLHDEPVPTIASLFGAGRFAGGLAGTAARTGALGDAAEAFATPTPRMVVPKGFTNEGPDGSLIPHEPINRGDTSLQMDKRIAQAASDALASKTKLFGDRLVKHQARTTDRRVARETAGIEREYVDPARHALSKLNQKELRAVTAFHGQGFHSLGEARAYFENRAAAHRTGEAQAQSEGPAQFQRWKADQRDIENNAALATKLHAKLGDVPTQDMQDAIAASAKMNRKGEQIMAEHGAVAPETALRSDYVPRAQVDATLHGKPEAQRFLDLTDRVNELHQKLNLAKARSPRALALQKQIDQLQRVQADQEAAARPERGTSERLAQQRANLFSGAHEEPLTPDLFGADNPVPSRSAQERADMRKGVETRTRQRAARPLDARIERAQARLGKIPTPEGVQAQIDATRAEQEATLHQVRSDFRAQRGAPPVEQGAPLDEHDPLFHSHILEGPSALQRIMRGQSPGMTSDTSLSRYGRKRGVTEHQRTGSLLSQASTDPKVFFGGAAKPFKIDAALRRFRAHVADGITAPKAGTVYDRSKWVRLKATPGAKSPIDMHTTDETDTALRDLTDQSLRDRILAPFDHPELKKGTAEIPADGQEYYLVSRHAYESLENAFKGVDSKTLKRLSRLTGIWRWATLMARPAWLVNNVAGNAIQAALAGAGPVSHYRAWKMGPLGSEDALGVNVENNGLYRNVFERPGGVSSHVAMRPIHYFTSKVVEANTRFENFERRAVASAQATKEAKAQVHGELGTIRSHFHYTSDVVREAMRNPTPSAAARIVRQVDTFLGDFTKIKSTPYFDVISPFHRWFEFIGKLTLTMPAKTPGRALLLQRLGQFGVNVQSQQFGGYVPNSMQGALQLPASIPGIGGYWKTTQGLNPFATGYQLLAPNDQSTTDPGHPTAAGVFGATNPLFQDIYAAMAGNDPVTGQPLKDSAGNSVGGMNPSVLLHEIEGNIPAVSLLQGYNTSATSLDPFSPSPKKPSLARQPQQGWLARALGYGAGTVKPFDLKLNQEVSQYYLKQDELKKARNAAAAWYAKHPNG